MRYQVSASRMFEMQQVCFFKSTNDRLKGFDVRLMYVTFKTNTSWLPMDYQL